MNSTTPTRREALVAAVAAVAAIPLPSLASQPTAPSTPAIPPASRPQGRHDHTAAGRELRSIVADLKALEWKIDQWLEDGHGDGCKCDYCHDAADYIVNLEVDLIGALHVLPMMFTALESAIPFTTADREKIYAGEPRYRTTCWIASKPQR